MSRAAAAKIRADGPPSEENEKNKKNEEESII